MGPNTETAKSATAPVLVLSAEAALVRITLRGFDPPPDGVRLSSECNLGSPLREICSTGSERGDGHKRYTSSPVPTHHTLSHCDLLKSVARRVVDAAMLHLIKMWLQAPVEEMDERGTKHRSTQNRDERRGSPQRSPISSFTIRKNGDPNRSMIAVGFRSRCPIASTRRRH